MRLINLSPDLSIHPFSHTILSKGRLFCLLFPLLLLLLSPQIPSLPHLQNPDILLKNPLNGILPPCIGLTYFLLDADDLPTLLHKLLQTVGSFLSLDLVEDGAKQDLQLLAQTVDPTVGSSQQPPLANVQKSEQHHQRLLV